MRVAQKLYEGVDLGEGTEGLIAYMPTDSFNLSKQSIESIRGFVTERIGEDYLPKKPNYYKSRGGAQEAHEAIRPTDVRRTPEKMKSFLDKDQYRLYKLIWERAVASQMAPARIAQRSVEMQAEDLERYIFRANSSEVVFEGYMKVSGQEKNKAKEGEAEDEKLPPLEVKEKLELLDWLSEQKFTKPPPRFSEASLVRVMEENGVGRPSTYAQIISTLLQRDYAEKRKRMLIPTQLGRRTNEFLVGNLGKLFNVEFTAEMEKKLDEIEEGDAEMNEMLSDFYGYFTDWLKAAKGPKGDPNEARKLLGYLDKVTEWTPPVKRGKRTFDDKKFVASMQKLVDTEGKEVSQRQVDALKRMAVKYVDQLPEIADKEEELGLKEMIEEQKNVEGPAETTMKKLELLENVKFDEPRKVGKRTYDDEQFVGSLRAQVQGGRKLSEKQLPFLDRFINKYADQIENFEEVRGQLGLSTDDQPKDTKSEELLKLMSNVEEWREPVKKGKRVLDDKAFYDSLSRQFKEKKSLSTRQQYALKRMIKKYADQIPDYENVKDEHGIK